MKTQELWPGVPPEMSNRDIVCYVKYSKLRSVAIVMDNRGVYFRYEVVGSEYYNDLIPYIIGVRNNVNDSKCRPGYWQDDKLIEELEEKVLVEAI